LMSGFGAVLSSGRKPGYGGAAITKRCRWMRTTARIGEMRLPRASNAVHLSVLVSLLIGFDRLLPGLGGRRSPPR
jgi:hypothetical protein